jgi:D-glycero-alpha-D-manno-heptose-7-phosphate kinase
MIVSKAPLRMSFVGGGSDLPSFYKRMGGAVLSTSIDKYIYVTVNKKFDKNIRISYSVTEDVSCISKIEHPIVRNALALMNINNGIEIASMADIPSHGSGLGSSSSYTVALLNALHAYKNRHVSKDKLGELASYIEMDLCNEPIGKQDQYAAAFGGLNLIEFHEDDSVTVNPIICKPETLKNMEESIIVFYTGRTRSASSILSEQSNNANIPSKINIMKEMVNSAYDMKQLLESNDLDPLGELLDKNWKLKRQMASGIADSEIDDWYRAGILAGAQGGKLLGAGNGGFMMFFSPKERHNAIEKAMKGLQRVPFSFDKAGSQIVFYQSNNI